MFFKVTLGVNGNASNISSGEGSNSGFNMLPISQRPKATPKIFDIISKAIFGLFSIVLSVIPSIEKFVYLNNQYWLFLTNNYH